MASAAPVAYPLGAPELTENVLTVDTALNEPERITQRISDITLQRFIVDRIFASQGLTVAAGAVIYDQAVENELYTNRDVERRMPGDEYPIVGANRRAPKVATSEDWGGKFFFTDEARRRNDVVHLDNQTTQLANTIVKKTNTRAILELEAAIASLGGQGVVTGHNWSAVVTAGTNASTAGVYPAADFALAQLGADREELGVIYDLWLVNPQEAANLKTVYGSSYAEVLASHGIEIFPSNRVVAGTAYAVARGQVGFLDYEQGLATETWREPKNKVTWVQSSVVPIMGVTNPFSIKKIVGLAG